MAMIGRVTGLSTGLLILSLVFAGGRAGAAFQRNNPQPAPPPSNYPSSMGSNNNSSLSGRLNSLDDQSTLLHMEEKRSKAINSERQRMIMKEANQLVQAAADLQASVGKGIDGAGREEQAKHAEAIEKMAKDVKERMKGDR